MKEAVEMLVLPIKTLFGHYIYDANLNDILAVAKISSITSQKSKQAKFAPTPINQTKNSSYYNHVATAAIRHCRMSLIHQLTF